MNFSISDSLAKKEKYFIIEGIQRMRKNFESGKDRRLAEAKFRRAELEKKGIRVVPKFSE